jgi:hypothetical protein
MALTDWTELEHLSGEIADSQSRLEAARATQNHGLARLLERQISEAEKWRDRLVQQITSRLTIGPGAAARNASSAAPAEAVSTAVSEAVVEPVADVAVAVIDAGTAEPAPAVAAAPIPNRLEGVASVWEQLSRTDIERVKRELGVRRAELLARHAEELRALEAEQGEIEGFLQAIEAFTRKFNVASGEVVVPFEERNARGQARG